jgi:hypothetical protein
MFNLEEYKALRATVRERGTARMCIVLAGVIAWAALLMAVNAFEADRAATLVPLMVLASTFEISFFIHTGVERIGRYLQLFFEEAGAGSEGGEARSGWETTIMAFARSSSGGPSGPSPLFVTLFAIAALTDFAGSFPAAARHVAWVAISFVAHLIFGWRLVFAQRASASQRALDLERFRALKTPASK